MKNIQYLSSLLKSGKMKYLALNYVVTSYNYKEMIDFYKFAHSIGASVHFYEYKKWGLASLDERYEEVAVFEPEHPNYKDYLEVVKNKIFDNEDCFLTYKLRPFS